jgi:two-component system nitrate/nitrite response regulator NarL
MPNKIENILIIEDHPLYGAALEQMLQQNFGDGKTVVVTSTEDGLRMIDRMSGLELILLDLNLPGASGIEAISIFQRKCPSVSIVVVSASESRQEVNMALRAGAVAFVSKACSPKILVDVIGRALAGAINNKEWIAANGTKAVSGIDTLSLNERQTEILALLSKGLSNKEIALCLDLAEITIKVHVSALFRLLGVVNRTQAVMAARRLGLGIESTKQ